MIQAIRFSSYLEALALEIKKTRSGEKSTLKLMAAGARLLENVGYRDLNIENICAEAQLAKGTFYVYFESKEVFLNQLISRYIGFEVNTHPQFSLAVSAFRGALDWVEWYERTFAANVGILRCLVQLSAISLEHRALWHQRNRNIVERIIEQQQRRLGFEIGEAALNLLRISIRSVGGMMDESLFERYSIGVGAGREEVDLELMIELHAFLIYRAIYGSDPDIDELDRVKPMMEFRVGAFRTSGDQGGILSSSSL